MSGQRGVNNQKASRAVVAFQVLVLLPVLLGFAALTIDIGAMYNAKAELQRTADAAALAAASRLAEYGEGDPIALSREAAVSYAARNTLFGQAVALDPQVDVVFGRANYDDQANEYTFTPTEVMPDAVQVTVRFTESSPNGPLPLYFAALLGKSVTDVWAEAIAIMVPRDIAIVADLSGSMNDDCEFQTNPLQGCLFDVWAALPLTSGRGGIRNGSNPAAPGAPLATDLQPTNGPGLPGHVGGNPSVNPATFGDDDDHGPRWGWMAAWGGALVPGPYSPSSDQGLYYIRRNYTTSDSQIVQNLTEAGYSSAERSAILSKANDSNNTYYRNRVKVMLGLAGWRSGKSGAKYSGGPADGNNVIASSELAQTVAYPFSGSWDSYIDYIGGSGLSFSHVDLRYRHGVKSFMNYLLDQRPSHSQTPELAGTPCQPVQAVKDAAAHMMETLEELNTDDLVSLEVYAETVHHEQDLTPNYQVVADRLNDMQAAYYDSWTNMGGGLAQGIHELTQSGRQRSASRKVIILLTDGRANVDEGGQTGDESGGRDYALQQAQAAADEGIRIFAVSHGFAADEGLMEEIAEIGSGEHFHAEGTIEQYSEQLDEIFDTLGGRRPVELIK